VSTVAAITWFFAGLKRVGPTRASTLSTVEPAVTVALAALMLDERIALVQLAGGALILAAVVLLARARTT
jgi:drug/metabolite transporter (DMT)-like permease